MTKARWTELMKDDAVSLTNEEIAEGWHFCYEFDGLLVNFNDKENEGKFCTKHCRPIPAVIGGVLGSFTSMKPENK